MVENKTSLMNDLDILTAMAEDMDAYLKSDVLYWPMSHGDMPKLTLGGYLMRQHRLAAVTTVMTDEEKAQFDTAVALFNQALPEKIVRTEKKGHEALGVRARQWGMYLQDVQKGVPQAAVNYATAVENRAIIAAIVQFLTQPPYQLNLNAFENVGLLDRALSAHWQPGPFIWDELWQPAYAKDEYWWLYGRPKG